MIFEILYESAQRNELILVDGGYCRFHIINLSKLIIYEILSLKKGAGTRILEQLKSIPYIKWIQAKCPTDLESNLWWEKKGFKIIGKEITKSGRNLNIWCLAL